MIIKAIEFLKYSGSITVNNSLDYDNAHLYNQDNANLGSADKIRIECVKFLANVIIEKEGLKEKAQKKINNVEVLVGEILEHIKKDKTLSEKFYGFIDKICKALGFEGVNEKKVSKNTTLGRFTEGIKKESEKIPVKRL